MKEGLIEGIQRQAEEEARAVIDRAEKRKSDIIRAAEQQAKQIRNDKEAKAKQQAEGMKTRARQQAGAENRKVKLKVQEEIFETVMDRVRSLGSELPQRGDFKDLLLNWTVEALLGIGTAKVVVKAPAEERQLLQEGLLAQAVKQAEERSGQAIEAVLAPEPLEHGRGLRVFSQDGSVGFNNTLEARTARYALPIRRRIYREIS